MTTTWGQRIKSLESWYVGLMLVAAWLIALLFVATLVTVMVGTAWFLWEFWSGVLS